MGVVIKGHGRYLPELILSNVDLISKFAIDTSDQWIKDNLGIEERRFAPEGMNTSDIASRAAQAALKNATVDIEQIQRIILGTSTADHINVSTACKVQYQLNSKAPAFDIVAACASFIIALDTAISSMKNGVEHCLVIGADLKSRFVNKNDRRFLPIFGDGGGALVLENAESDDGFLATELWSDGSLYDLLLVPAGGSSRPASLDTVQHGLHGTRMKGDGRDIGARASKTMAALAKKVCEKAGMDIKDVDLVIPHHANGLIMKDFLGHAGLPEKKMFSTLSYTGNLVSGSLAYALSASLEQVSKPGNVILLTSVGAGASGGAILYKVPNTM